MTNKADLLITNAIVYTVDPARPRAEAVAVRGDRIVFVGANADAAAWLGAATRVIDGQGCTLLPGLIDSHFHLQLGALRIDDLQLSHVRSLDQLSAAMRQYAAEHPDKPWISGQGLAYDVAGAGQSLTRHHLDTVEPQRPAALMSIDFHTVWANTAALEQAGILHGGAVPHGSEIVMAPDGTATGQLNERDAFNLVLECIPPLNEAQKAALFGKGLRQAAAHGITSVHNMDGDDVQMARYAQMAQQGDLPLRMYIAYSVTPATPLAALAEEAALLRDRYRSGLLRAGFVKFFMDGVIESHTAFMLEPYVNRPESRGDALWSDMAFKQYAVEADRLGLQIAVHAIGDAAIRRTLDGYAAAADANGPRDRRHRIEHIELLHPQDLPRFAQMGVVASMQPLHVSRPDIDHFTFWTECVPRQRWGDAFPWRDLRAGGARLVFGSDWPVVTMDPYVGMEAAVSRPVWAPGLATQEQTLADTIAAYTRDAAWVEFQEDEKGQIRVGLLADLVLLDADLFAIDSDAIAKVRPVLTVCDGRVVYER